MALVITKSQIGQQEGSVVSIKYAGLSEADAAPAPIEMPEYADRSVQVVGTFNAGTVVVEGSNDGVNWSTLTDPQGNNASFTAAKIEQLQELTRYMRPRVSAGTGVVVDVIFVVRRASSMRT